MALTLNGLGDLAAQGFDTVIDVRSPDEFAEDHLPGAINLPVLDNAERARVGTIYKQQSPFLARKIGAALVARNAARHLEETLADMPGGWRPLVYCWRGGQRSGSFAMILSQVGWRVELVSGGYKHWRGLVARALEHPPAAPLRVIDGNTGSAKTALLAELAARGAQVIDLEGLANHRGSLFGHRSGGQPSQKAFERELAMAIHALDPARPVYLEAESSKIGALAVPKGLWAAMARAPRIRIAAPLAARAAYLVTAYGDLVADAARLAATIDALRPLHPAERIAEWHAHAGAGRYEALAAGLMQHHYDPRYEKHRDRFASADDCALGVERLDPAALADLAGRILGDERGAVRPD